MEFVYLGVNILVIFFLCVRISDQDKTIRELTDKLMARNFTDYVTGSRAREDPTPEIKTRKAQSWYDDPNVPDGEDE